MLQLVSTYLALAGMRFEVYEYYYYYCYYAAVGQQETMFKLICSLQLSAMGSEAWLHAMTCQQAAQLSAYHLHC